jgi:DNA-binding response OmpR family regulator
MAQYRVVTCSDETAAARCLASESVDAVVLEPMALADEEWHFAYSARREARYRTLPIIVCTSLDERGRGAEIGAAAYLIKPVTPAALASAIAAAVAEPADAEPADAGHSV